jgi:hypothetical protein
LTACPGCGSRFGRIGNTPRSPARNSSALRAAYRPERLPSSPGNLAPTASFLLTGLWGNDNFPGADRGPARLYPTLARIIRHVPAPTPPSASGTGRKRSVGLLGSATVRPEVPPKSWRSRLAPLALIRLPPLRIALRAPVARALLVATVEEQWLTTVVCASDVHGDLELYCAVLPAFALCGRCTIDGTHTALEVAARLCALTTLACCRSKGYTVYPSTTERRRERQWKSKYKVAGT